MPLTLVRNDISRMATDAVVNAANSSLHMGGGVCGALFSAAGAEDMIRATQEIGHCDVGSAVITPGFALPAKYVIHAVGPIWQGGTHREKELLTSAYAKSLELAYENGCASIAFPLISSGIYGYPHDEAMEVAVSTIVAFLAAHDMDVYLAIFTGRAMDAGHRLFSDIEAFIDDNYVDARFDRRARMYERERRWVNERAAIERQRAEQRDAEEKIGAAFDADEAIDFEDMPVGSAPLKASAPSMECGAIPSLDAYLKKADESFGQTLMKLICEKQMDNTEVYRRANMDRKLFSKIISTPSYRPKKQTVLALAIALRLSLKDTQALLSKAGYILSHSIRADLIVEYFIQSGNYDIFTINEVLFDYDDRLLGSA